MPDPDPADAPRSGLLAQTRPGDNAEALTVSELSQSLKRTVEDRFGHVRLRGEISGWKRAASGHAYLCLKDEGAVIDAVLWKGQAAALQFQAQDGLEVVATGRLTTYPGRSKYQIVVERLELAGEGALMALYERLRASLAAEGLFDRAAKRPLPFLPRTIGVVTSPTGAVIRDILHRIADRCPGQVLLWPVKVQGQGAAAEIAAAIAGFDAIAPDGPVPRPDLLIVARGGGSIEDLWAFNEEPVVRAIAACRIPVISAVGHETDTSLADFAADLRAPTPTAAAEIAVPVRAELQAALAELGLRSGRCARRHHERGRERLAALVRVLPRRDAILGPQRQRLDDLGTRLDGALGERVVRGMRVVERAGLALRPVLLGERLARARERLEAQRRLLTAAHPDRPLARGYVQVRDGAGRVVTSAAAARAAGAVRLRFGDGAVDAAIDGGEATARIVGADASPVAPAPRRPRIKPVPAEQGRLL